MTLDQNVSIVTGGGEVVSMPLRSLVLRRGPDLLELLRGLGFAPDFKDPDFENILQRMLARVPDELDKRQGSVIYDALAPAAVEFTEAYIEREANRALSYASMSTGDWLDLRVAEHGVFRQAAAKAVRYGYFWADEEKTTAFDGVTPGGRYSVPNDYVNYIVTERVAPGIFALTCEEAGQIGNKIDEGTALLPVEYLPGLALVELGASITPGEDEESDEALYERFVQYITRPPFGGNRSDYEEYFRQVEGVGSVKLFRADPEKGHVTAYILGADWDAPGAALVEAAQAQIDPADASGEGIGLAPMAHSVHVYGACAKEISVETTLTFIRGWTIGQVQAAVEEAVEGYFLQLRKSWADYTAADSPDYIGTVVRVAQIEAAILNVEGVADVGQTKIGGLEANLILERDEVPALLEVKLHAAN